MGRFWSQLLLIHKEGYRFIALGAALTALLAVLAWPWAWLGAVVTVWCACFFRDPPRYVPQAAGLLVSPADGIVVRVDRAAPPPEMQWRSEPCLRIAVFMNVFNCHVNRAPAEGVIKTLAYRKGKFFNAELDKASEHNERQVVLLQLADAPAQHVGVVQIAGLVARRIVSFVEEGQRLRRGERLGLIRFGSRVDLYLPDDAEPLVGVGQTAVAGETVLARWRGSDKEAARKTAGKTQERSRETQNHENGQVRKE